MMKRKKILIVDVPETCYWLSENIQRWGYESIGLPDASKDSISEVVAQEKIDLLIVAQELTFKGPSRSNDWQKGDDIKVDYEFGVGVLSRLRLQKNSLPVILLTTDSLKENKWMRDDQDKLDWVMLMKNQMGNNEDVYGDLKKTIEEFLGRGLTIHEWARFLIVADDIDTCLKMKEILGSEGYKVDYATMDREASQKIEQNGYDLILVDIKMSGHVSSGTNVLKSFQKKEKKPKFIVLSMMQHNALKPSLQKEGVSHMVNSYMDKPNYAIPGRLINRVNWVMEQYSHECSETQ